MPKIDQNDPRLTAYALDEMSAAERAAFETLLQDDPAARAAVDDIRRTAALLGEAFAQEPLPERAVVLHPPQPHWLRRLVTESWTLWVPLGAAAAFGLFFWRVYLPDYNRRQDAAHHALARNTLPSGIPVDTTAPDLVASGADGVAAAIAPRHSRPAAPTGLVSAATTLKTGHFLTARQNPSSQFAVNVGTAAYADVRRSLEAGERPPTGLVRIEELVNFFPYRYPRPAGADPLALATEMHAAPWAKEHLLVRIGLQSRDGVPGTAATVVANSAPTTGDRTPATVDNSPTAPSLASERPLHEARDLLTARAGDEIRALAARDVKVQVDFNPEKVLAYRLLGYENRLIKGDDVEVARPNNDFAAGHSVTALYEVIPLPPLPRPAAAAVAKSAPPPAEPTPPPADTAEWLTVKLRYTEPGTAQGRSLIVPLHANATTDTPTPSPDFQFAAAVAGFGLILQDNPNKGTASWDMVEQLAQPGLADDTSGQRREFVSLVKKARTVDAATPAPTEPAETTP